MVKNAKRGSTAGEETPDPLRSDEYHRAMRTRILLVEDEPTISEPLAESLGRDGFEAEVAATLASAREAIRREAPDLVLLDVMLPTETDVISLVRSVRDRMSRS